MEEAGVEQLACLLGVAVCKGELVRVGMEVRTFRGMASPMHRPSTGGATHVELTNSSRLTSVWPHNLHKQTSHDSTRRGCSRCCCVLAPDSVTQLLISRAAACLHKQLLAITHRQLSLVQLLLSGYPCALRQHNSNCTRQPTCRRGHAHCSFISACPPSTRAHNLAIICMTTDRGNAQE